MAVTVCQRKELAFTAHNGGSMNILRHSRLFRTYAALARKGLMTETQDWLIRGIRVFTITIEGRELVEPDR